MTTASLWALWAQLGYSWDGLNMEDSPVSPILLKFPLFNSEIFSCQRQTLDFFFFHYCFDLCLFETSLFPRSVSNPAPWNSEVQRRLEGTFLPTSVLGTTGGSGRSLVSFTLTTEQWSTLFYPPGCWHLNHKTIAASPGSKPTFSHKPFFTHIDKDGSKPKAWKRGESASVPPPSLRRAALRGSWGQSRTWAAGHAV